MTFDPKSIEITARWAPLHLIHPTGEADFTSGLFMTVHNGTSRDIAEMTVSVSRYARPYVGNSFLAMRPRRSGEYLKSAVDEIEVPEIPAGDEATIVVGLMQEDEPDYFWILGRNISGFWADGGAFSHTYRGDIRKTFVAPLRPAVLTPPRADRGASLASPL